MKQQLQKWELKKQIERKRALLLWLLLSAFLQLSFITKASIWHDEGYSLLLIRNGVSDIIARTARDVHPPLYYLTLNAWTNIFGTSELAARSLSTVFILGTIAFMHVLIKRLFGYGVANTAALFMATAPFLIRYGQEARMYAMLAFIIAAAAYFLVTALDDKKPFKLYVCAVLMALGFYTHYYTAFMVPVFWGYVFIRTKWQALGKDVLNLKSPHWWLSNILIVLLFLPWLPFAYAQFTRVQGGFWIPPVDIGTLPATLGQLTYFTNLSGLPLQIRVVIGLTVLVLIGLAIWLNKKQRNSLALLAAWALFAPFATVAISIISRPVYIDRYFVFASVAFYPLIAALLYVKPLNSIYKFRLVLISAIVLLFSFGIRNVYLQADHQMRKIASTVNEGFVAGDIVVAGELYVYLDFSYYNQTGTEAKLYAPGGINGYGETSLFYEKSELITVPGYETLHPFSERVWLIGKPGEKDYYNKIPTHWQLVSEEIAKDSALKLYTVN
jgi:mannosyltransferase